jgi:hypothetical protein
LAKYTFKSFAFVEKTKIGLLSYMFFETLEAISYPFGALVYIE